MTRLGNARFEGDTWDLASARAANQLINDPFGDVVYLSSVLTDG